MLEYCKNIFSYQRRRSHEVMVGDVGIGGKNPIRIQSMTIADTMNTQATVAEVIALVEAGCEIVRITAPSKKDAENLRAIKKELRRQGVHVPLVADIHFTPNAALIAADIVEKVRINPGNYADKKKFETREYSDAEYAAELERIRDRLAPLILKCKANGVAMRIGVNHGSLADRVMNRYGDTPEGMVQSALEFIEICEDFGYRDIVVSMKSSIPRVMIRAYRLLAARMAERGMTYPFHLGVTEAGDGEDGRIKSAVGIGALLEDGIGDTIRVSLTEDAIHEIPVARALVAKYQQFSRPPAPGPVSDAAKYLDAFPPFEDRRRVTEHVAVPGASLGGTEPVRVIVEQGTNGEAIASTSKQRPEWLFTENGAVVAKDGKPIPVLHFDMEKADVLLCSIPMIGEVDPGTDKLQSLLASAKELQKAVLFQLTDLEPVKFSPRHMRDRVNDILAACTDQNFRQIAFGLQLPANCVGGIGSARQIITCLVENASNAPIVLGYRVSQGQQNWQLDAASTLGTLISDGIGDAVFISGDTSAEEATSFIYTLLQATRRRLSRTEFISCPSCGRTLFNLQTTTARIKAKTSHLTGVKIAIMGCIVNGPGEMADADFGYVGAGVGKVNLFVGKDCVERNIPEDEADARLIRLIKRHGKWVEPPGPEG